MASAKKAPAKKTPAKKAPTKSSAAKKPAAPPKKASSVKKSTAAKKAAPAKKFAPPAKKAAAKKAPPAPKKATPPKKAAAKVVVKKPAVPAKKVAPPSPPKKAPAVPVAKKAPAAQETKKAVAAPAKKAAPVVHVIELPPVKGVSKEGVAYTKDFDVKFLTAQRVMLLEERAALLGQAVRLEDEANALIEEQEMGDVQFDDEGGEGDTMVVERERDLTLSAQARQTIADIESALERLTNGRYGYSLESGKPIPRERLQAIPWATMLVEEKVGGIGRK